MTLKFVVLDNKLAEVARYSLSKDAYAARTFFNLRFGARSGPYTVGYLPTDKDLETQEEFQEGGNVIQFSKNWARLK